MGSPCPLCEYMISRFKMAQHQLPKDCNAIQDMEKNQTTKPITYRRADGTYEYEKMIATSHNAIINKSLN